MNIVDCMKMDGTFMGDYCHKNLLYYRFLGTWTLFTSLSSPYAVSIVYMYIMTHLT